jgi:hypothetical protein
MKKLLLIPVISLGILFNACNDESEDVSTDLSEALDIESEATMESNYEEADMIVDAGFELLNADENGRVHRDEMIECATIVRDTVNKILTIDYGDGCTVYGRNIKGVVTIAYNSRRLIPGAFREATFTDFFIDEVKVEGTRRLENTSESLMDAPTFAISLTGGKVTFTDDTQATRESSRVRTWIRGLNPLNDEVQITGTANGTKRDGISYSMEVLETLVYKRGCRAAGVWIPVSGIKQLTFDGNVAVIDYGDGTCDNEVSITINGGETFIQTIVPRGRR